MASTTATATVTALLGLTTPFVQQPSCTDIWELTTVSTLTYGSSTTYAVLASNSADARFASCQPSGWANVVTQSRFSFSPAVCPSGWTYYDMAATIVATAPTGPFPTHSAAYCCAGYVASFVYFFAISQNSKLTLDIVATVCGRI